MEAQAAAMGQAILHRGPDDSGTWIDASHGIALTHRRLSILDLSPAGHQPMHSGDGRYVLAFNGEIYNHLELRKQLELQDFAVAWRGHSDTETLLACIDAWGLERALAASIGMFALALWDRHQRTLQLARDRMGEKPLYYGWQNGNLLFGSELKALLRHPAFERRVNRDALALLLRHNYIPAPYSIWQGISKLQPATVLTLAENRRGALPAPYWSLSQVAEEGARNPMRTEFADASNSLEKILGDAVDGQMMADVPLGALLSGGVDSSVITALMQARSTKPIKTFCIGFSEKAFDESRHASAVAHHLGTDHTTLQLSANDVLKAVHRMPTVYDEPFADSSQLPTTLVMALARQQVIVALSGDGGDEIFGGYNRYISAPKVWSVLRWLPYHLRQMLARLLTSVSVSQWDRLARPLAGVLRQAHVGNKMNKLGQRLERVNSLDDLYVMLVTEWESAEKIVLGSHFAATKISNRETWPTLDDPVSRMMMMDGLSYLPDDILVKVDRAAMAVSMETRAPFLDHRVVEFAARLPMHMKIARDQGKVLLRSVLYRHVPRNLIDRPKVGFGIPLDSWLRNELRDWAEALLSPEAMANDGFFNVDMVRSEWRRHVLGEAALGTRLWPILMFQLWKAQGEVN